MNIRELYENKGEFLDGLLERVLPEKSTVIPELVAPEYIPQRFLEEFVGFSYLFTLDSTPDGENLFGEVGGVTPKIPNGREERVIAFALASLSRTEQGFRIIKEIMPSKTEKAIEDLKEREIFLRKGLHGTAVDGNVNISHYDFTTQFGTENLFDIARPSSTIYFASTNTVFSLNNKSLKKAQYAFHIPVNHDLIQKLRSFPIEGTESMEKRAGFLNQNRAALVPEGYIAGFRYALDEGTLEVTPLISEKEAQMYREYFRNTKKVPKKSELVCLGTSQANGMISVCGDLIK